MSVIWKYLDKKSAAVDAVKDYASMKFIIDHTDDEIKAAYANMDGVRSPQFDGMPHSHNPQAAESRIIKGIEDIDVLRERYRQAMEYMEWFQPAWDALSEDEQYVLSTFYSESRGYGDRVIQRIAEHYSIEQSSAYNKKNRALQHLTTLLFGKG